MRQLLLFTTLGCHLCEEAETIVNRVLPHINAVRNFGGLCSTEPVHLMTQEIAETEEFMTRYGLRIPVLRLAESDAELGWPFDDNQVFEFLLAQLT